MTTTSVTKTKAATYEVKWIEDMVLNLWITRLKIMKRHDYGYLDEIEVCREDQLLYKNKDGVPTKEEMDTLDKRRAQVMIYNIDKQLFQRRLIRNLEKFIGGREYGEDLRLLERTI
ncbi:hypothetical protein Tco_1391332 [Tanacetum coccineum]